MYRVKKVISKILMTAFVITNIFVVQPAAVNANTNKDSGRVNFNERWETEIIIKYKDSKKSDNVKNMIKDKFRLSKLETKKSFNRSRIELVDIGKKGSLDKVVDELRKNPEVEYAQPNYRLNSASIPSDARFNEQWGLLNNGQEVEGQTGRSGVDINAVNAWDITQGNSSVVIGLLDSGVDINHNDLKNNIYINTGEIPGNGIDDDNNGYIDDVYGWDFANGDNTVFDSSEEDVHGTYTAGIIAASSNSDGISGVAPKVKILPLKFINGNSGYTCDAIEAIEYAMAMGVKVINCSFGGIDNNYALKDAMQSSGILFVCAGGNRGGDASVMPVYPACFDIPNILSVASIDSMGVLAPFSSYGMGIDIAAPGVNILSTTPENTYGYFTGTSVSAPFVTGIAALIMSYLPRLSFEQVSERIKRNAVPCVNLDGLIASGGRADAFAALSNTPPQCDDYVGPGGSVPTIPGDGQGGSGDTWYTQDQLSKIKEMLHYGESGVNPASGNYSFTCTDISVPSPGFQINISRTYNSRNEKIGAMGKGWTFGFEGSVVGSGKVWVTLPSGSVQTFNRNSDGSYTAEDSRSTFVKNADNTYILTTKDQYSYGFNSNGFLVWMKDRNANVVTIDVDSAGKVRKVTDTVGRQYTVSYGTNGFISTITGPDNRTVTYGYDSTGRYLVNVTDPMGGIMRYSYDIYGFLNKIEDHYNNTVECLTYDHTEGENYHKVKEATDSLGNTCRYSYDTANRKTTISDTNGRLYTYWFDASLYTIKYQDSEGRAETTEYYRVGGINKFGDVKSKTDRNGNRTQYDIDERGNVIKVTNPDASTMEFRYDAKNNLIQEQDETGRLTFHIYDDKGINPVKKVQPLNGTDTYTEGTSSPDGFAITSYEYYTLQEAKTLFGCNAAGLLKCTADPEGNITTYTYDSYGNIRTTKDPENNVTTDTYNASGWKTGSTSPGGYNTGYTYDKNGLLEKVTFHNGETERITYDMVGRKTKQISPNLYNPSLDNISSHTYTGDHGYRYTYYDNGKLQTITDPEGYTTTYIYDVYGNIITETKPNGLVYRYRYDLLDRLTGKFCKDNTNVSEILLEEYSYSVLSDGKTQKTETVYLSDSSKAVTVYIYDYAGRVIEKQNPNGTKSKAEYNPNGTVSTSTSENGSITYYKYDGLNRLAEKWTPFEISDGNTLYTYEKSEYDKAGRKTVVSAGKGKVLLYDIPSSFIISHYSYYKNSNLKMMTDSAGRKTEYSYDSDGNLSGENVYIDATAKNTTEYVYNHIGKPVEKKVYIAEGDLYGFDFNSTRQKVLSTDYTYDGNGNLKTVKTPDNTTTTYTYDKMDRQLSESRPGQDEHGNSVIVSTVTEYDWEGKPLSITDAKGNKTLYTYNKRGFLEKVTNADGKVQAYYYDRAGRKVAEVSPQSYIAAQSLESMNKTEYIYDVVGRLKAKVEKYIDPKTSQWVTVYTKLYKYDNSGNVVKELDALGYNAGSGSTVDERINSGYGTEYSYNLAGNVILVIDPVSQERGLPFSTKFEYDGAGRKISETDARGVATLYRYDDAGNMTSISVKKEENAQEQVQQSNTYDLAGRNTSKTDAKGNKTAFTYNAFNSIRIAVNAGDDTIPSNTVSCQYDVMGRVKKQQDGMGGVDTYTYDTQGRVISHTRSRADGSQSITTSVRYDINGNKRFKTDGNGNTVENIYDCLNLLVKTGMTVGGIRKTTSYTYDANGNQLTVTDWRGNIYTSIYDPLNRLIEKKDPYATIEKLEYNHNNIQIRSWDALNNMTEYRYDRNNRLILTIDPEGHTSGQSFDDVGNIKAKTDGRNISTTYDYDEFGRLRAVINAKSETTSYTYDSNGNMLTQTDGNGHVTIFEYNVANKPVKRIEHGGRTGTEGSYTYDSAKIERYTYYADGSMYTKTDRNGKTTTYTYDIHSRLLSSNIGSESISYTYDNNGNQLTMADGTGTTARTYDEENRVLTKEVPKIGKTTFRYDILTGVQEGYTAETSTDPKGNVTAKVFDKAGRLKEVRAGEETTFYEYYLNGNRKSVRYPNGALEEYTYYRDNLLRTLTNKKSDGTILDTYQYAYDGAHNQISKSDAKGITRYAYDPLNRLEKVTEPNGILTSYTFDRAGNRLTETVSYSDKEVVTAYTYDEQNRLVLTNTRDGSKKEKVVYSYDSNGNMTSKVKSTVGPDNPAIPDGISLIKAGTAADTGITFYEYNVWNELAKTIEGDKTITCKYDGTGLRVEKAVNGQVTRYLYEYDKVVLEVDEAGSQTARNIQGLNILARIVDNETSYYMYNGHGDVTALIGTDGTIEGTYYYDAFGNIVEKNENVGITNPYRYAGYRYDDETNLYYLNARYYDSKIARFLTEDTYRGSAADPLSLNLYTYCHNEPVMYWDPSGHWEVGDSKLSAAAQAQILEATTEYLKAKEKGYKAAMNAAHQKAEDARDGKIYKASTTVTKDSIAKNIKYISGNKNAASSAVNDLKSSRLSFVSSDVGNDKVMKKDQEDIIKNINSIRKNTNNIDSQGTTIGPDIYATIRNEAVVDTRKMIDPILAEMHSGFWHGGNYFLVEDSYAYFYYKQLKDEVAGYKFRTSALEAAIIPATIYEAYQTVEEKCGPMPPMMTLAATAVVSVLSFAGIDDGYPSVSGTLNMIKDWQKDSKGVATALAKFNYIMDSDYKYLMLGFEGRWEFLDQLDKLKKQIYKRDFIKYNNATENDIYKDTTLDYINKIYNMNKNFNVNNAILKEKLQKLTKTVTKVDANTINEQLFK